MNIVELYRKRVIQNLFEMKSFANNFSFWLKYIKETLEVDFSSASDVLNIGDNLCNIFKSTSNKERGQSEVSSGGAAWEALVCWYLNLCLAGSNVIATKSKKNYLSEKVSEALSVNYGSFNSSTESDIVVITFPETVDLDVDDDNLSIIEINKLVTHLLNKHMHEFDINVIQCKTNWNDNAQIPMLWDIVYNSSGFHNTQITLGRNGISPRSFKSFKYSFVTVPTSRCENITSKSTQVKRVDNLSGGNFWGMKSLDGVSRSLKEIFMSNFENGINKRGIISSINNQIRYFNDQYIYFFGTEVSEQ